MGMPKFKVGDAVRLILPSYISIAKGGGLMQPDYWEEADPAHDKHLMLGGRYIVLEVSVTPRGYLYRITEPNPDAAAYASVGWSSYDDALILDKDVENCPYQVGDKVLFRPKCSAMDVKYLATLEAWNLQDPDTVHEVRGIINNYYIVIDYEVGHIHSHPLRWIDFERVAK
jgi:hypothetical protein